MTQRRGSIGQPKDLVEGSWPDGEPRSDLAVPLQRAVAFSAALSRRLTGALAGRNLAAVAREADVARSTIYDVRSGATWPDVVSVFKFEEVLGVHLWARGNPGPATPGRASSGPGRRHRVSDLTLRERTDGTASERSKHWHRARRRLVSERRAQAGPSTGAGRDER